MFSRFQEIWIAQPGEAGIVVLKMLAWRNSLHEGVFAEVCETEAQDMRKIFGLLAVAVMLAASGVASAQMVDPSTGVMVDPTTDPSDFSAVASGQPGNIGMELAAQAQGQVQAMMQAQAQTQQQEFQDQVTSFPTNDDSDSTPAAVMAKTPKPVMTPNGGSFKGSVQIAMADIDSQAMIYYTVDGSKPTQASQAYVSPLTVTAKTKVRAMADDGGELPSGVVTKTFKVKS